MLNSAYEHFSILNKSRPIDSVLQDNSVPETIKQRLRSVQRIRRFAVSELGLPDNKSYTRYVDIRREYVSWAVFVAAPFEMDLHTWCFWVAGCVPYRGYFDEREAQAFARSWQARGYDVYVAGVPAYSTLGWFSDPVLNTMLNGNELDIAGLIFHELAHQKLYVTDDPSFNEAFAETVRIIGQERWLQQYGSPQRQTEFKRNTAIRDELANLISHYREALMHGYRQSGDSRIEQQKIKSHIYGQLYYDLDQLKSSWRQQGIAVNWPEKELNNAALLAFSTYQRQVHTLLQYYQDSCYSTLDCFYMMMEELKMIPYEQRQACLTDESCSLPGALQSINVTSSS